MSSIPRAGRRRRRKRDSESDGSRASLEYIAAFFILMALLSLSIGFMLSRVVGDNVRNNVSMASWPRTPGVVIESRVVRDATRYSSDRPLIRYRYSVGGTTYTGDRVDFNLSSTDDPSASQDVQRYYSGREVQVRYHPDDPSVCALEQVTYDFWDALFIRGAPALYWVGGLLVALGLLAAFAATVRRGRTTPVV